MGPRPANLLKSPGTPTSEQFLSDVPKGLNKKKRSLGICKLIYFYNLKTSISALKAKCLTHMCYACMSICLYSLWLKNIFNEPFYSILILYDVSLRSLNRVAPSLYLHYLSTTSDICYWLCKWKIMWDLWHDFPSCTGDLVASWFLFMPWLIISLFHLPTHTVA